MCRVHFLDSYDEWGRLQIQGKEVIFLTLLLKYTNNTSSALFYTNSVRNFTDSIISMKFFNLIFITKIICL